MDIVKPKSIRSYQRTAIISGLVLSCVLISVKLWSSSQNISLSIDAHKVQTAHVNYGDLQVKVTAFGTIASNSINVISAKVDGVIAKIHIKSGEKVTQGQTLVELTNPELNQIVEETQWNLEELASHHRELLLNNKATIIDAELALFEIEKELSINKLTLEAQTTLLRQHNVVSKISYEETKLNNSMLKRQYQMATKKLSHLKKQMNAKAEASVAKINKNKKILTRAKSQVEALTIRSTFSGYVDESSIELGQNLTKGHQVAKIIGDDGFYAQLKVPEYNASHVKLHQTVLIETRDQQIEGNVTRISPSVEQGNVNVDVSFISNTSTKPRLEQAISGNIIITEILDTFYIKRPIYANNNVTTTTFISQNATPNFARAAITFGALSDEFIEIKSGVNKGDIMITSDISAFVDHKTVKLK